MTGGMSFCVENKLCLRGTAVARGKESVLDWFETSMCFVVPFSASVLSSMLVFVHMCISG